MKKITVEVTKEDIEKGTPCSPFCCPIALSLERMGYSKASVGSTHCWLGDSPNASKIELPAEAKKFVDKYDDDFEVEPFKFELEVQG